MEAQVFGEFAAVLSVLVNSELKVLAESLVELLEVILVFRNLGEQIHALLNDVFADDFEDLVLLKSLARNVEWQIFGIDDAFDEIEVLWNEVFAVIHDEHPTNVELDVVALLFALEKIEGCTKTSNQIRKVQPRNATCRFGTKRIALNSS